MYVLWSVLIIWGTVKNNFRVKISSFAKTFIISFVAFCSFCLIMGLFNETYFSANYLFVLAVPLLVTLAADMYANMEQDLLNQLAILYLICSITFAVWVQIVYFPSYLDWLDARSYMFGQKNSAGQIWCSAIFITMFFINYKGRLIKYIAYIGAFYLFIMTAIVQCRTALLGLIVAIAAYAISKSQHKIRLILILLLLLVGVMFIPFVKDFIEQALLLSKYEASGADINTFSSGRLDYYEEALFHIISSPIIGVGKYYVDCSYLSILAESGLIGFCIIEIVLLKKIVQCYELSKKWTVIFFMTFFYMIESLLEGFPPFGPGVSSFMFWFLSEVLYDKNAAERKTNEVVC